MRWLTYRSVRDSEFHAGLLVDQDVHGHPMVGSLLPLLGDLEGARTVVQDAPFEVVALAEADVHAPIPVPPSIRDFMSFEAHVVTSMEASGATVDPVWYEQPVFYFTNPAAVRGPADPVAISPGSEQYDYELELAAVMGREISDATPAEAVAAVAGYLLLCDWSARDLQFREMRQALGPAKGKDGATSFGPLLVTPDELGERVGNGYDVALTASVNGTAYSSGNWADLHWSFGQMIAYASRGTRLVPGDVIGSGTVGTGCILELSRVHGSERYPWLRPGDVVTLDAPPLGSITATVEASAPAPDWRAVVTVDA
jgi:2-keto-4-pentenoate hydratase/2-oxohepta-3-ene-1,7-dioic acid hydratase in catechol pathway